MSSSLICITFFIICDIVCGIITSGSDTGLYNEELFEGDILINKSDPGVKNAVSRRSLLWPHGVIAFKVSEEVGCPESKECRILMAAMDAYHRTTCIRFKEWTGENDFIDIFYNKDNSGACWSAVGRIGGRQSLSLGKRCWYIGISIHELGHAAGFWHEMNRPDRDRYVYVYWQNILPMFKSAFRKNSHRTVNTLGESFDIKSIMMYDEYAFSKDGKSPTLKVKSGAFIGPIWKKSDLSRSDIRRVFKLYNCKDTNPKAGYPFDFNCSFNNHICGFRNRDRSTWKWRLFDGSDGYLFATGDRKISQLYSINLHSLNLKRNEVKIDGCLTFSFYTSNKNSSLKIKQEMLWSVTDVGYGMDDLLWESTEEVGSWQIAQINLTMSKPYRLVFESSIPTGRGAVAIDNVRISRLQCKKISNNKNIQTYPTELIDYWI